MVTSTKSKLSSHFGEKLCRADGTLTAFRYSFQHLGIHESPSLMLFHLFLLRDHIQLDHLGLGLVELLLFLLGDDVQLKPLRRGKGQERRLASLANHTKIDKIGMLIVGFLLLPRLNNRLLHFLGLILYLFDDGKFVGVFSVVGRGIA